MASRDTAERSGEYVIDGVRAAVNVCLALSLAVAFFVVSLVYIGSHGRIVLANTESFVWLSLGAIGLVCSLAASVAVRLASETSRQRHAIRLCIGWIEVVACVLYVATIYVAKSEALPEFDVILMVGAACIFFMLLTLPGLVRPSRTDRRP